MDRVERVKCIAVGDHRELGKWRQLIAFRYYRARDYVPRAANEIPGVDDDY